MTLITSDEGGARLDPEFEQVRRQLQLAVQQLETLQSEILAGDPGKATEMTRAITNLSSWIRSAITMEKDIEQRRKSESGIVRGDYALDLDAARDEVRCRLGRIRRCCREGRLSE